MRPHLETNCQHVCKDVSFLKPYLMLGPAQAPSSTVELVFNSSSFAKQHQPHQHQAHPGSTQTDHPGSRVSRCYFNFGRSYGEPSSSLAGYPAQLCLVTPRMGILFSSNENTNIPVSWYMSHTGSWKNTDLTNVIATVTEWSKEETWFLNEGTSGQMMGGFLC